MTDALTAEIKKLERQVKRLRHELFVAETRLEVFRRVDKELRPLEESYAPSPETPAPEASSPEGAPDDGPLLELPASIAAMPTVEERRDEIMRRCLNTRPMPLKTLAPLK